MTPQNYCAGVSEAAQSNNCSSSALGVLPAKKGDALSLGDGGGNLPFLTWIRKGEGERRKGEGGREKESLPEIFGG